MDAKPSSWTNLYLQPNPGTIMSLSLFSSSPHLNPSTLLRGLSETEAQLFVLVGTRSNHCSPYENPSLPSNHNPIGGAQLPLSLSSSIVNHNGLTCCTTPSKWIFGRKHTQNTEPQEWASLLVDFRPIEAGCCCHGLAGQGGSQVHDADDGFHAGEGAEGTTMLLSIEAVMISIT
uniref:Uncharacterized protein n=1 Tax=Oryza nivara TaxID=4536 RepID=A0A0E0HE07_ORYNI